jgi:hypothetical protein
MNTNQKLNTFWHCAKHVHPKRCVGQKTRISGSSIEYKHRYQDELAKLQELGEKRRISYRTESASLELGTGKQGFCPKTTARFIGLQHKLVFAQHNTLVSAQHDTLVLAQHNKLMPTQNN